MVQELIPELGPAKNGVSLDTVILLNLQEKEHQSSLQQLNKWYNKDMRSWYRGCALAFQAKEVGSNPILRSKVSL